MSSTAVDLLFVLVHYRTPERIGAAVAEARVALDRSGLRHRLVVVDNSGDAQLDQESCEVIVPGYNLGYAGAANRAFRHCAARFLTLSNPDVKLSAEAMGELLTAVRGCGAVGPTFFWDQDERVHLPPTEDLGTGWLDRAVARFSPAMAIGRARAQWRQMARDHWLAEGPIESARLSGALLLLQSEAYRRVGPFDENFQLYFEETDWLRRARSLNVTTKFVPSARAMHTFDASAKKEPMAKQWFAASEALFRRRYRLRRPIAPAVGVADPAVAPVWEGHVRISGSPACVWFELSASAGRFPAAAERLGRAAIEEATQPDGTLAWQPPHDLAERVAGWWLTLTDERGRELGVYRFKS